MLLEEAGGGVVTCVFHTYSLIIHLLPTHIPNNIITSKNSEIVGLTTGQYGDLSVEVSVDDQVNQDASEDLCVDFISPSAQYLLTDYPFQRKFFSFYFHLGKGGRERGDSDRISICVSFAWLTHKLPFHLFYSHYHVVC